MSLDERLRAYNAGKPRSKPAPEREAAREHAAARGEIFECHPISGESLALPEQMTADFRRNIDRDALLFFDLESTGLGSGEQVYPFLIGFARGGGEACTFTTLFADTPADEEFILSTFLSAAEGKTLVSFNGKSFDLPLILRRAEKYDIDHRVTGKDHIDLYHLIRRIYPEKPARLIDAETRLLGFSRTGDLGGAEVAQSYFELLRFGDSALKSKILDHNMWDVLTLVSLMQKVAGAFAAAREGRNAWAYKIHRDHSADRAQKKELLLNTQRELDGRDLFALGQILRAEKNYRGAANSFIAAYRAGHAAAVIDAVRALTRLGKTRLAGLLARYALAREDDRVQRHLARYAL